MANVKSILYIFIPALSRTVMTKNNGPRFLQNLFACQFFWPAGNVGLRKKEQAAGKLGKSRERGAKLCQSLHLLRAHSILNEWPAWIFYLKLTIQFHLHFNGKMCQTSRASSTKSGRYEEAGKWQAGRKVELLLQAKFI